MGYILDSWDLATMLYEFGEGRHLGVSKKSKLGN